MQRATFDHFDHIVALTHEFNSKYYDIELDPGKVDSAIAMLLSNGIVFVSDEGFIGGVIVPDIFRNWTYLQELGWFAKDRSGLKLLNAFINEAKLLGVDEVRMCTLQTSDPIAERVLLKKGFTPVEQSFMLRIKEPQWPQLQPYSQRVP